MRDATPFLCNNLPSPCLRYVIEGKGSGYFARHSLRVPWEQNYAEVRGEWALHPEAKEMRRLLRSKELGENERQKAKQTAVLTGHSQLHGEGTGKARKGTLRTHGEMRCSCLSSPLCWHFDCVRTRAYATAHSSFSGQQAEASGVPAYAQGRATNRGSDTRRPATDETSGMQAVGCKKGVRLSSAWCHRLANAWLEQGTHGIS